MLGLPLDHVAIAVASIAEAAPLFERLTGSPRSATESVEGQNVRVAFVGAVELIEPTHPDSAVGRFLQKRGGGLHHVAYRTPDLRAELVRARDAGFEPIDTVPRAGARGHLVAFLHPRSTGGVLVELVEHAG
jgi:methylmalonyl-CoA/ethylmalonyl-CoA epimerase